MYQSIQVPLGAQNELVLLFIVHFFCVEQMGVWSEYNWDSKRALNGLLIALFFPVPFLYAAHHFAWECNGDDIWNFSSASLCVLGNNYFVLATALLYFPMYLLAFVVGNGWLNDLNWTVIPLLAFYQFMQQTMRTQALVEPYRMGLLLGILLLWSARLTYNYSRREEWTFGAREDFRFQVMRRDFGRSWVFVSFFAQYLSQHVTETLFCIPYYFILSSSLSFSSTQYIDLTCLALGVVCIAVAHVADDELRTFVSTPNTKHQVLQTGLWRYSRHPNYLAESTFHWSIGLWAAALTSRTHGWTWASLLLIGPAFNSVVLYISAILNETQMARGNRAKAFAEYKKKTRMIL